MGRALRFAFHAVHQPRLTDWYIESIIFDATSFVHPSLCPQCKTHTHLNPAKGDDPDCKSELQRSAPWSHPTLETAFVCPHHCCNHWLNPVKFWDQFPIRSNKESIVIIVSESIRRAHRSCCAESTVAPIIREAASKFRSHPISPDSEKSIVC